MLAARSDGAGLVTGAGLGAIVRLAAWPEDDGLVTAAGLGEIVRLAAVVRDDGAPVIAPRAMTARTCRTISARRGGTLVRQIASMRSADAMLISSYNFASS